MIPIEGDWNILPQHIEDDYVRGKITIEGGFLFIRHSNRNTPIEQIRAWMGQDVRHIEGTWESQVSRLVEVYNVKLRQMVEREISKRKSDYSGSEQVLESLGIPLRRTDLSISEIAIPVARRKPPSVQNLIATEPIQEYHLPRQEFDYILGRLSRMVDVIERSPSTFAKMEEEELRNILLVILNGHYEAGATGETFNGEGKTDIFLKFENRAAFIAECKNWTGAKAFSDAIDQLRGYTTWRDTKCALLFFHRGVEFEKTLDKIENLVAKHSSYLRTDIKQSETHFRYTFRHPDDADREMTLAILFFHVRTKTENQ